jgi:4-hydroxythreonine-4-phosphate dehydrogenase
MSAGADKRPVVAITLGDVAGIGPEVTVGALVDPRVRELCRPVVVGDADVLRHAATALGVPLTVVPVSEPVPADGDAIACWSPKSVVPRRSSEPVLAPADIASVPLGSVDARAGRAAYVWLVAATQAALSGQVDAVVTAPLHKVALKAGGHDYPGHTEILADECDVPAHAMMLYVPPGRNIGGPHGLGVAHVTLHTAIHTVPGLLNSQGIFDTITLLNEFLKQVGCENPRIGVCALNPHGGEAGRFGDQEATIITPAVEAAAAKSIHADGPIPADALLRRAIGGEFDGVAAMYHDQGHIALKLVAFNQAVNVTLGLPIVRTSPSHGTAFDIAGQGKADPAGMIAAIETAVRLSPP